MRNPPASQERDIDSFSKRRKLTRHQVSPSGQSGQTDIKEWRDLQRLLAFAQAGSREKKQNIKQFKTFLESIAYGDNHHVREAKKSVLLEYLRSQTHRADEAHAVCFIHLVQTWSFAAQSNDERLFSAMAAVLALFLQATSGALEFQKFGNMLCQTLLDEEQLKLFERGLSALKAKEDIVLPCIRLLTEIVSYDGGLAAGLVWRARDTAFKNLETFLSIRENQADHSRDVRRKPSIRVNALRYLFANLRFQCSTVKAAILTLGQGKVARSVFQHLEQDTPDILLEMLNILKINVLGDDELSPHIKRTVFRESTLIRIACLYSYNEPDEASHGQARVPQAAHSFLTFACTSSKAGILENSKPTTPASSPVDQRYHAPNLMFNEGRLANSSQSKPTFLKNRSISTFLQKLRPHAHVLEKSLILAIFEKVPELAVDYFGRKENFSFEPKLSATSLGYSMFLISAIQLPLPLMYLETVLSSGVTPVLSASTLVYHVLPSFLTRKLLTRCMNQNIDLNVYTTLSILIAAFQKIRTLLQQLETSQSWPIGPFEHLAVEVRAEFYARCPEIRHVIAGFRKCDRHSILQREAYTRLILLYYSVIPQAALEEKFDISVALSEALLCDESATSSAESGMQSLMVENLLGVAHYSPDMRWFHKPDNGSLSPFTMLLRHYAQSQGWKRGDLGWALLKSVSEGHHLLEHYDKLHSIDLLIDSIRKFGDCSELYLFLDQCFQQGSRKSVVNYEKREALFGARPVLVAEESSCDIDLLLIAITDQWPFLVQTVQQSVAEKIATWLTLYLDHLRQGKRRSSQLEILRDKIIEETRVRGHQPACRLLKMALTGGDAFELPDMSYQPSKNAQRDRPTFSVQDESNAEKTVFREGVVPSGPPEENQDHTVLQQWRRESIPEIVLDGTLGELMLCLCSIHWDIRQQALSALSRLKNTLKTSNWPEALQIYMLVGELVETFENLPSEQRLPYVAGALAARCCTVLTEPLHPLYSKICRFLNRGPEWEVDRIPSYWADKILLHPPTEDDAFSAEVEWFLDYLIDGLRTPEDMNVYRRRSLFERVLTLSGSPSLPGSCSNKILRLLYRCTYVDGSTTLITRCGLLSWIQGELSFRKGDMDYQSSLSALANRADVTCDKKRIEEWSGRSDIGTLREGMLG